MFVFQDDYQEYIENEEIVEFIDEEYSFVKDEPFIIEEDIPSLSNASTQIDTIPNGHTSIISEDDIDVNLMDGMKCEVVSITNFGFPLHKYCTHFINKL